MREPRASRSRYAQRVTTANANDLRSDAHERLLGDGRYELLGVPGTHAAGTTAAPNLAVIRACSSRPRCACSAVTARSKLPAVMAACTSGGRAAMTFAGSSARKACSAARERPAVQRGMGRAAWDKGLEKGLVHGTACDRATSVDASLGNRRATYNASTPSNQHPAAPRLFFCFVCHARVRTRTEHRTLTADETGKGGRRLGAGGVGWADLVCSLLARILLGLLARSLCRFPSSLRLQEALNPAIDPFCALAPSVHATPRRYTYKGARSFQKGKCLCRMRVTMQHTPPAGNVKRIACRRQRAADIVMSHGADNMPQTTSNRQHAADNMQLTTCS
jgi:hypothetical protein